VIVVEQEIEQGTRRLARHRLARAVPNRSHRIPGDWMTRVDPECGPVHVRVEADLALKGAY
jgi:hypothetical protein